ncbi:MAG TPA: GNAT family N-acetyltransferase [Solirubrobacterales bacterium]|nr:GNAT family N-acetyltransferase [Solirubrobacterales bacterium]
MSGSGESQRTYPGHRETDIALRDGSTVHVRPVRPADEDALFEFLSGLSSESRVFRFFSGGADLRAAARLMADVDYGGRYGLVATRDEGRLVGQGAYLESTPGRAEVAFTIADEMQGRGLGTILLAHLAEVAEEHDIDVFEAEVMAENHKMIEVFRESGLPVEMRADYGAIRVELPTSLSAMAVQSFEERDRLAALASVRRFLEPRSVAVVGASRRRGTVGGELFHNMLDAGFDGVVYPVNPGAEVVQSVRAYPSVASLPDAVDVAVIAVPAADVVDAAKECAASGVPALVVISSGFAEVGPEGAELQKRLLAVCRGAGMRLIGPNCLGILNTGGEARLNATFAPRMPPAGNVGFATQSGALGLALIDLATERALGVSSFASIGNRADVTANDLLEYWESDDRTEVALLYIESFSDPRRFSRLARRMGRRLPIVAVKSGRSTAGQRGTASHTGALLSASDVTVDALFEQSGVIRTDSLAELLDVASLLANQPLPTGPRVGIVTNAGGPGIMCADACEAAGLEVPPLPEAVQESLRSALAPEASLANPVDLIATATAEHYRRAIAELAACEEIDALVVIFIRPLLTRAEDVAESIRAAIAELPREIPVQTVFMSAEDHRAMAHRTGTPTHLYPEDAARALGRVMRHVRWRAKPAEDPARFPESRDGEAAGVIAAALADGRGWLRMDEIATLLDCHGIAVPAWRRVPDADGAAAAAAELGGSVALKAEGPEIIHKSELGAVRLGLADAGQVARAAGEMDERLADAGAGRESFLVQRMVEDGVELIVGVVGDDVFGPVLACGAGGTTAELLKDVAVRVCPLTRTDAREMVHRLAVFPLLEGYRGAEGADLGALEELILRVSAMVECHDEIAELDLNPVLARPDGTVAVDARIRVEAGPPPRPWPSTWKLGDSLPA